jgi:iron complex outermembrane receptor protein
MHMKLFYSLICLLFCQSLLAQSNKLSGKITDAGGRAIGGASIHVLNTNLITASGTQGDFSLAGLASGKYTIEVTAIGYATLQKEINTKEEINVVLVRTASQLDAVLVTAQKKEESLQQVPFSVLALSARQVNSYRLWNTRDLTAIIPNLYSADPGDNRNVTAVRGITSTSYDPAVATYIDGVNQFGLDTYIAQLSDIERIEVLRGPQGTLYGRNAMGGVINIITKQPSNRTNVFAEATIGNYGQQRYAAGFRAPLVKDKLYIGASGVYDRRDGFYTNQFNNKDFDRQHSITGNYYLKYIANPHWTVTFNLKHNANRNNGTFPLVNGVEDALAHPFELNQNAVTKMIDNTFNTSLSINHTGRHFNLSSQTAWQSNHRYYKDPIDGDFSPIDGVTIINNYGNDWNKVKVFTEELRFTSPAAATSPLKWTAGTYLFIQNSPVKQTTHFGEDAAMVGSPDKNYGLINTSTGKGFGVAVFGEVNYTLTKQLELIAGLRYDYEHKKQQVLGSYLPDGAPAPVFDFQADTSAKAHFNALSPKLGLLYHVTRDNNLYATYSRGYRTGGLTPLSSDPSVPPLYAYKPEYSNNIEAGSKNSFLNNKLRINAALFYTTVTDVQVPTLVLPDAITITKNAGKLESKGAEIEIAALPVRGLEINYQAGYTNAEYKTLKVPQNGAEADLSGRQQIFTPSITSMLALQYQYSFGGRFPVQLTARGEWQYLGRQYYDLANTIRQSPYNLLNARAGIATKNISLFIWGRNLGNRKYIAYAYDFGAVHLGSPETWGVTLRFDGAW